MHRTQIYAPFNFLAPPSWKAIVKLTSLKHRVGTQAILSKSRIRPIVAARHEAMHLIYDHCGRGTNWVGKKFDRDHTSVLYAIKKRKGVPRLPRRELFRNGKGWNVAN